MNSNSNQKGQGLSEYALILVLVSVVVVAGVSLVGGAIGNTYSNVLCVMDNSNSCEIISTDGSDNPPPSNPGDNNLPPNPPEDNNPPPPPPPPPAEEETEEPVDDNADESSNNDDDSSGEIGGSMGGGAVESDDDNNDENDDTGNNTPPNTYQYFRLVAKSEVNGNAWTSVAEINLVDENGNAISKSGWSLHHTDSQETSGEDGRAINAFDGNNGTIWHTQWQGGSPGHDHEIQINLGQSYQLTGLRYLPRQSGENGRIAGYEAYISKDGISWTQVASGTFPNSSNEQVVNFNMSPAPDVCANTTLPANSVFQFQGFTGSTVSDLSGNNNHATLGSGGYTISNNSSINTGTYNQKTLGVHLTTGGDINTRQVVFEQGGTTRGINVYIGDGQLYVGIWNRSSWDTRYTSVAVIPNANYTVVLVYNNPNVTVYVNGSQAGTFNDTGDLTSHSGGIGVMGMNSNTYYHDGGSSGNAPFAGAVSELAQWNTALSGNNLSTLQTYLACANN